MTVMNYESMTMAMHSLYWTFIQEYARIEYAVISCIVLLLLLYSFVLFVRNLQISSKVPISVQKVLIITAHPDDECMFFSPTIQSLLNSGHFVHLLCLSNVLILSAAIFTQRLVALPASKSCHRSTPVQYDSIRARRVALPASKKCHHLNDTLHLATAGNFNGLGKTRSLELFNSCEALGIPLRNVYLFNHSDLQDHPEHPWKLKNVEKIILPVMYYLQPHLVITFDNYGVSGHSNHISIHDALQSLSNKGILPNNLRAFHLKSSSIFRKYVSILDLPLTILTSQYLSVVSPWGLLKGWWAMLNHWSQFVWFRALYIVFSRYMLINTLEEILPQDISMSSTDDEEEQNLPNKLKVADRRTKMRRGKGSSRVE